MRTPLILLASLATVGALYGGYMALMPPTIRIVPAGGSGDITPRDKQANEGGRIIGPGQGVWVSQYDAKLRLVSQFRASDMLPKADGTVEALFPQARIPLSGGNVIHLAAAHGNMLVKDTPVGGKSPFGANVKSMPTRGRMNDVTVKIEDGTGRTVLAAKVNNIAFDFDTFRIYTEGYKDAAGTDVAADRVKVEVRGDDVDFDGYGLTLRWDDKNGVIRLLEIAHGEQLTIKRAPAGGGLSLAPLPVRRERVGEGDFDGGNANVQHPTFNIQRPTQSAGSSLDVERWALDVGRSHFLSRTPRSSKSPSPSLSHAYTGEGPGRIQLASTDPAAVAMAMPASAPAVNEKRLTPYRAKLLDNVRIEQANETVATGDTLTIDFIGESSPQKDDADAPELKPAPATAPAVAIAPPSPPSPATTTAPAPAAVAPSVAPAPPVDEKDEPIIVRWEGPLRIVPLESAPLAPMRPGDAVAELTGKSITLKQAGATVTGGSALYRTADGGASLKPAVGETTVSLTDAGGRALTTESIEFDGKTNVATLTGAGRLNVAATPETNDEPLAAAWKKEARLTLAGRASADGKAATNTLSRIDLTGDVTVDHSQLALAGQSLALHFAPGATADKPVLKTVTAHGNVKAVTTETDAAGTNSTRTIEADAVELTTGIDAKGQPVPERFTATGKVHAYDDAGQNLYADHLDATLAAAVPKAAKVENAGKPAAGAMTATAVALKELNASGHVKITGRDDAVALSDRLRVTPGDDGKAVVELADEKDNVRVTTRTADLVAPLVRVDTSTGVATLAGPGTIRTAQTQGDAKRPVTINWAKQAELNSATNLVTVTGDVKVASTGTDGARQTSTSDRVLVTLADRAVDPKVPKRATTDQAASPLDGLSGGTNVFGDKEPVAVTLSGNVNVSSVETVADQLARRFQLLSEEARYDLKTELLTVPGKGGALYEDVRPQDAGKAQGGGKAGRDAVRIAWEDSLVADQRGNKVRVEGNVVVNHQPLAADGVPLDVVATGIDVDLEPQSKSAATRPTTVAATSAMPGVRKVVARGPVSFTAAQGTFEGQVLTYDAATGLVTAAGAPVRINGTGGNVSGTASEVRFDLTTGLIDGMTDFVATMRK